MLTRLLGLTLILIAMSQVPPANADTRNPRPWRFDPRRGHPTLSVVPDPSTGKYLPVQVTFRAVGKTSAQDRVLRIIRTAGGPATFDLPHAEGALAVAAKIEPLINGKPQPGMEYRTLNPPARLENFSGDPAWTEPADWRAYWERARADLAKVPMNPRITEVPEKATATGRLYRVELDSLGGVRIVCWYTSPKDVDVLAGKSGRRYPAVQTMPGYGAAQGPDDRTAEGYITLAVNPRGHGASAEFWPLPANHLEYHIDDPETYYYRSAYMDCLRAMQFLRGRSEVDGRKIAVEGSSQGGAFALATAALDGHTAACGAYVPFLSDLATSVRLTSNGGMGALRDRFEAPQTKGGAAVRKSLSYIDARFMAAHVHCPTIITSALMDRTCPPAGQYADYNSLPAGTPKSLFLDPPADHELTDAMVEAVHGWFDRWLK